MKPTISIFGHYAKRGVPHYIRSDNGPEFIARDVQNWLAEMGIGTIYIEPGSLCQNHALWGPVGMLGSGW